MDTLFFIVKYIPFWTIPLIVIAGYFCYLYWLKDIRIIAIGFAGVAFCCVLCLGYWVGTGGFSGSVQYIQEFEKSDM